MAFHPYPQVIAAVFNRRAFGPPRGLTPASACPRIAHPASRPRRGTQVALLRLAFAPAPFRLTSPRASDSLAHSTKGTPSHRKGAPTARGRTVSGTVSLPSRGAFHLSLTVLVRYRSQESIQAWRVVPPASHRVSRVRRYSGRATARVSRFRLRGHNPVSPAFPCRSATEPLCHRAGGNRGPPASLAPQPRRRNARALHAAAGLDVGPRSLAATRGISFDFSSSGYLDVSVPPVARPRRLCSGGGCQEVGPGGFSHSETPGSKRVCRSPGTIAACRVLLRLPVPRHPPCALTIFLDGTM